MKKISILGSTGSIGLNALKVIDNLKEKFDVVALSANKNASLIIDQVKKYNPSFVAVADSSTAEIVRSKLIDHKVEVLFGRDGLIELSGYSDIDLMLNGLVGSAGTEPTLKSISAGVDVALSNKESLVMAGEIINSEMKKTGAKIFPVDSEHSAIWQCLSGESMEDVNRIILTGSGGPFRTLDLPDFKNIKVADALNHPNWSMGKKITIDSATMMNKGLEVIEALWLFNLSADKIDIVIHPQSIIHSMVEFKDSSVKAQLGVPDMKVPIQYALTYPRHLYADWESLDLTKVASLTFEPPNFEKFPCIKLAYDSLKSGGSNPAVLNVANEHAVYRFLAGEIGFVEIPKIIELACGKHDFVKNPSLTDLLELEAWAIRFVNSFESKLI